MDIFGGHYFAYHHTIIIYFDIQIIPDLASGNPFKLGLVSLCKPLFFFLSDPHFLMKTDASGIPCTFPAPVPESAISPMSPGNFKGTMLFRNPGLSTRRAHCSHFSKTNALLTNMAWKVKPRVIWAAVTSTEAECNIGIRLFSEYRRHLLFSVGQYPLLTLLRPLAPL